MKKLSVFLLIFSISISYSNLFAQKAVSITSPNGLVVFKLWLTDSLPQYAVNFNSKPIIDHSNLGVQFKDFSLGKNFTLGTIKRRSVDEKYDLIVGKNKIVRNHYHEATIPLQGMFTMNVIVRVYDDGVAFRYDFPKQKNWNSYQLTNEQTSFRLVGNPMVYTLHLPNYKTSHEGIYTQSTLQNLAADKLMDMPTLFRYSDSLYVAISEAALRDYAGMYLQKDPDGVLQTRLSPLPGQNDIKVKATLPHQSPWRVVFVGNKVGTILESNLLTNLNEPSKIKDWSWLKPGKATWSWWNGDIIKGANFPVGLNFKTQKYYIDFCATNHIAYHSIIEHGNRSWYKTDGEGFDPPPPNADVTQPVDTLEMERVAAYSRSKGVGLRVWVHWKPLSENLEKAFALYEKWNIKGLMIDFMDRDDQEMVNWIEKVLQTAAKYHLHVQFHGAYKPTGLHRTYPNELTKEGVLNLENLKWGNECDPEHNLMIPFTRMIAGPTDYHAGGFRALPRADYKGRFLEPNVLGTRCHHLALYVVYESYLQLVSDYPQAYQNQLGFEFIQQVPTIWDETRILDGQVGDYIVTARRKGTDWYVGVMNDWTARNLPLKLDFLPTGNYEATIYADATDSDQNPNHLNKTVQNLNRKSVLTVALASGGGQVLVLKKMK